MISVTESVVHLRSVHFSLLVVCVALYGLTVAGKSRDFDNALAQLAQIEELMNRWEPRWLESAAGKLVEGQDPKAGPEYYDVWVECRFDCEDTKSWEPFGPMVSTRGLRLELRGNRTLLPLPEYLLTLARPQDTPRPDDRSGPLWPRAGKLPRLDPQFVQPVPDHYPLTFSHLEFAAPPTLKSFETLWNGLGSGEATLTYAIDQKFWWVGIAKARQSQPAFEDLDILTVQDNPDTTWPAVSLRLEPMPERMQGWWRDRTEHSIAPTHQYTGYTPWGVIHVPALVDRVKMSSLPAFIDYYDLPWSPGTFAMNFPDLSALTLDTSEYSFDKLRAILKNQSDRSRDDIELFGLTIPAVVISTWGGPIVILVQLYFLLHFRAFRQQLALDRETPLAPWIGIYPDVISKATTVISAFALPPLSLGILVSQDIGSNPVFVFMVGISAGLGAWAFAIARGVWNLLELENTAD